VSESTDRAARFARAVGRYIPDAMSTCIVMMLIVAAAAFALGNSAATVADAYYRGLWMLVPFTMQMTLILVLSSSLASSPLFRRAAAGLARMPRSESQVFTLAVLATAALSYLYWGLGIALGPLLAIYFAREAEQRGIAIDFPFLLATGFAAQAVWQYGLSASGPLLMNTPGHFLEKMTGLMPLSTTIWSPAALIFNVVFLCAVLLAARLLKPARCQQISAFPDACKVADTLAAAPPEPGLEPSTQEPESYSDRLEKNSILTTLLAAALAVWLGYHFGVQKRGLDLNALNTSLLMFALLVHRNVRQFSRALQSAIVSCWPVVVLYHLYAGVAGLIQHTSIGEQFARAFAAVSTPYSFPLLTAIASAVVAIFVPSSGGQWVIQGFVTTSAAEAVGVSAQRGMLAVGVGDQMGNFISPFWAVVAAGIARIDFRRFIGYSFVYSAIWFVLGVLAFTFLPA
jgi:short-chain fatty acids transporter